MVSRRKKANETILGKIDRIESRVAEADKVGLPSDAVDGSDLDIPRGAITTEHLGVVNKITTDSYLTVKGPNYQGSLGYTTGLGLDTNNNIITSTLIGVPLLATVDPNYTVGPIKVTIDGTASMTIVGLNFDASYAPIGGDRVYLVSSGDALVVGGRVRSTPQNLSHVSLSLINGWDSYTSAVAGFFDFGSAAVTMDANGLVLLKGLIRRGAGNPVSGTVITTLPLPFRPTKQQYFYAYSGTQTMAVIEITPTGDVLYVSGDSVYISLENIRYHRGVSFNSMTLLNGWISYSSFYEPPGYYKDANGIVTNKGLIKSGVVTVGTAVFTYPAGFQPPLTVHFPWVRSPVVFGYARVGGSTGSGAGQTLNIGQANATYTSLDGTWFIDKDSTLVWSTPLLLNGWLNYSGLYNSAAYTKTSDGVVIFRGFIKAGTGVIFTLPPELRPSANKLFMIASADAIARLDVSIDGTVTVSNASNVWVSMDNIMFVLG